MAINVGDLVEVIEDGKAILSQVVELGEDAWGEAVAFVHRLEHDGKPLPLRQTASTESVGVNRNGQPVFDKPVPFIRAIGKSAANGSTGVTAGTTSVAGSTLDTLGRSA